MRRRPCGLGTIAAVVERLEDMPEGTRVFAWIVPGEARVYPVAELEQARAWVAGG